MAGQMATANYFVDHQTPLARLVQVLPRVLPVGSLKVTVLPESSPEIAAH
jgi:hypothetical protein